MVENKTHESKKLENWWLAIFYINFSFKKRKSSLRPMVPPPSKMEENILAGFSEKPEVDTRKTLSHTVPKSLIQCQAPAAEHLGNYRLNS